MFRPFVLCAVTWSARTQPRRAFASCSWYQVYRFDGVIPLKIPRIRVVPAKTRGAGDPLSGKTRALTIWSRPVEARGAVSAGFGTLGERSFSGLLVSLGKTCVSSFDKSHLTSTTSPRTQPRAARFAVSYGIRYQR